MFLIFQIGNNSHAFIPQDSISDQIDEHSKEEIEIVLKSDVDISDNCDLGGTKSGCEIVGSNANVCEVIQQNIVPEGNEIRENKLIHTPDLVMDLPTQPDESAVILESPDMTAAERFAKQNQCTLKKNTKQPKQVNDSKCNIPPKPPIKIKPEISLKPVCLMHVSKDVKQ